MGFNGDLMEIHSGNLLHSELEHGPVEIVDFPINSMVISQFVM